MQCDYRRNLIILFVWLPLSDVQFLFRSVRMIGQCDPYMIQAFERAHGSGAYGNGATVMVDQFLDCIPVDGYIFRVHLVSFNFLAFHRLKSSCPYVQCQFLKVYAFFLQCFQYSRGEMQSCSRCGY